MRRCAPAMLLCFSGWQRRCWPSADGGSARASSSRVWLAAAAAYWIWIADRSNIRSCLLHRLSSGRAGGRPGGVPRLRMAHRMAAQRRLMRREVGWLQRSEPHQGSLPVIRGGARSAEATLHFLPLRRREQLAEHGLQDAAVAVVVEFDRRVDADLGGETRCRAVGAGGARPSASAPGCSRRPGRGCRTSPRRSGRATARSGPCGNSSGSTPMPTRLLRWIRSKLAAITARTPSRIRALGGPVAAAAGAVLRAGQDDQRHAFGLVLHGRVVDASSARRRAGGASRRLRCRGPAGCGCGCWRTCRGSSPGRCRGARRSC